MNCLPHMGRRARGLRSVLPSLVLLICLAGCSSNTVRSTQAAGINRFWVNLRLRPELQGAAVVRDYAARGQFVMDELRRTAAASQGPVISFLQLRNAKFQPFWVANVIWVEADEETRRLLAGLPEVESIEPDRIITLDDPVTPMAVTPIAEAPIAHVTAEENVRRVRAPEVWDRGIDGRGVVVGILDTGFVSHPAITDKYRGYRTDGTFSNDYNWYDTSTIHCASPCDGNGHGTHVTGTVVGRVGYEAIGVAWGAQFISCKALDNGGSGTFESVVACLQWFLAPTQLDGLNPVPAHRPNIINMSLGGGAGGSVLLAMAEAINNLQAAGILSVAASGNSGGCGTVAYPAALPNVLAIGALTADPATNTVTTYTSTGPVPGDPGLIKPDLVAPGDSVRSSWLNDAYRTISGTSMASPAVSGVAALVMSANKQKWINNPAGVAALLEATANPDVFPLTRGYCQSTVFGHGLVNADAAVVQALR